MKNAKKIISDLFFIIIGNWFVFYIAPNHIAPTGYTEPPCCSWNDDTLVCEGMYANCDYE